MDERNSDRSPTKIPHPPDDDIIEVRRRLETDLAKIYEEEFVHTE